MRCRVAMILTFVALAGCDTARYVSGTLWEDARRPARALNNYEKFIASRPNDPRACEVRLRAGDIYRRIFGRCGEARRHYEAAIRGFPRMTACVEKAHAGLLSCPDYFPTEPGLTWVYADSFSGGRAMRLEWESRPSTSAPSSIATALFAGNKRLSAATERYEKSDWSVWRLEGASRTAILRYPYEEGMSWTATRGKYIVEYVVVDASVPVRVRAGEFNGCLKIRESDSRFKTSWKYDYYCPGVGRVKTSIGGPGFENPNTELLRFGKIDR